MAADLRGKSDEEEDFGGYRRPKEPAPKDEPRGEEQKKEEPCWEPSGILAEFSNKTQGGVVLKFTEPLDAAKPTGKGDTWKVYPFKGDQAMCKSFEFNLFKAAVSLGPKQSCYLFGRDPSVADILLENPSCSMQHAVIQFREKQITRQLSAEEMTARGLFQGFVTEAVVRPYLMDLESTNKTFLNGDPVEGARYYEVRDKDVLRFGESAREYVLMKV